MVNRESEELNTVSCLTEIMVEVNLVHLLCWECFIMLSLVSYAGRPAKLGGHYSGSGIKIKIECIRRKIENRVSYKLISKQT